MTKKILLIIGILAVIGIALFLVFGLKPQTEGESHIGFSIKNFWPFGNKTNSETSTTTTQENNENPPANGTSNIGVNQPIPRLRKLSSESVAGAVIFDITATKASTTSAVRFVEKGTGNVYEARSDSVKIERLTNTTIPKIIRAFWLPDGSGFLAQTLSSENEMVETSFVKLNKSKASTTVESLTPFSTTIGKLPTDIKEITIKPDGTKIFYYTISGSYSKWYVSNPDGTGATLVASHPLTEWLPKWISGNTVIMQAKSSSEFNSFSYSFDVSSKTLKKLGTGGLGLSINPNLSGTLSLVSSGKTAPQLFIIDNKNITSKSLDTNTLAEKCVWLTKEKSPSAYCATPNEIPNGNYPDAWYKGLVSTEDYITKIDTSNDILYNIASLYSMSNEKIDVVDMSLSPDETHLIFRNKIDGYLWMLRIGE
jgi:hypothetical protein